MASPGYYAGNGMAGSLQNLSATLITLLRLSCPSSSPKRFSIFEIEASQNGVPNATDCPVEYSLAYASAAGAGTSTSLTPNPLGGGFVAGANLDVAVTAAHANYTAEPTTYTQAYELWHKAVNQRGSALWQAAPFGEIVMPATASQGPGLRASSPDYASTAIASMRFSEI